MGPAVGAFAMYRAPLAEYLAAQQLRHWEAALRALAARALGALVAAEPKLFAGRVLDGLLPRCLGPVLEVRASLARLQELCTDPTSLCQPCVWLATISNGRHLGKSVDHPRTGSLN